ncbi:uncharacterized protein [Oscarella lobularis]|uniref:uncharacterized protein n=1 Tax=Oscarella lobularis TaxID=121494 RepID=UPI0033144B2F
MTLRFDLLWIIAVFLLPSSFQERLQPIVKSSTPSQYNSTTQQISTELQCTYPADYQCPMHWVTDRKKISSSKGVFNIRPGSHCESNLTVFTFAAQNAFYQCAVTTPDGITVYSEPIKPQIQIPLRADAKTVTVHDVTQNATVKLSCPSKTNITSLENLPIPNKKIRVQWYKDTSPLPANLQKYHHTHGMHLIIKNFSANDLGVYKCFLLGYGILRPAQKQSSVTVVLGSSIVQHSPGKAKIALAAGPTAGTAAVIFIVIIVLVYASKKKKRGSAKLPVEETMRPSSRENQWHHDLKVHPTSITTAV